MSTMEEQVAKELNTISWTQIPAVDIPRAQKFYNQVFGWIYEDLKADQAGSDPTKTQDGAECNPAVVGFSFIRWNEADKVPHAGFMKVSPENLISPALHPDNANKQHVSVSSTITVKSIDETLPRIVEAGGEIFVPKNLIPGGMGATASFVDTEKNVIGLWSQN